MQNKQIFSRLKVLEFASVLAGPSVGQFFAELGAEVIKIENPATAGDVTRSWTIPGEIAADGVSAYFSSVNWGKLSLGLDLSQAEGLEIAHQLISLSDVVIASFKPGDAEKLGLDYASISKKNPKIIYGHITGYGTENSRVGYDAIVQAEAGFVFLNASPGETGIKMPVALMDIIAGHHLKEALLLAIINQERCGAGAYVHVSLIQAAISSLANQATNFLVAGKLPQPEGSLHPNIAPYGNIFTTLDEKQIIVAVGNDRQFQQLCVVLDMPMETLSFSTAGNSDRVKHKEGLHQVLQQKIAQREQAPLLTALQSHDVPAGAVHTIQEVCAMPEAAALLFADLQNRPRGMRNFVADMSFSGNFSHLLPPPAMGAHTLSIVQEKLHLSKERVTWLQEQKILL